jgi:phage FluMu gp28-like protein
MTPAIQLTAYQKISQRVRARFYLKRWARQTGKTFDDTLAIADDGFSRRTEWVILSRGERQSKRNIEQLAVHCRAYGAAAEIIEDTWEGDEAKYKSLEIILPNKSKFIGLPANPDTARGFSANVHLDEFAFHKDSRKIWTALFPIVTRGFHLRVSSTPQGKQNKFYDLDTDWAKKAQSDPRYVTSKLDIHEAVAGGLDLRDEDGNLTTPEDLRAAMGDDDAFDQEYLVLFIDEATAFLSYELIAACEDPELDAEPLWLAGLTYTAAEMHALYLKTKVAPPMFEALDPTVINAEALYLGMDIGRKRDLSVIWLDRERQGLMECVAAIALRKTPFFMQKVILFSLLAHPMMRRACIDQSGLGLQLAEEAHDRFGDLVEGIDFTTANKEVLATGLKQSMEDRTDRIPAEPAVRNSLHSVKKFPTGTGHFRFDAERTDETGHADHFWAKALARHANSSSGPPLALCCQEPERSDVRERMGRQGIMAGVGSAPERRRSSLIFGTEDRSR